MGSLARYRTAYILSIAACVLFVATLLLTLARTVPNLVLLWQQTRDPISELCGCQTYYSISTHPYFWTGVGVIAVASLLFLAWIATSLTRSAFHTRVFVRSLTTLRTETLYTALGMINLSIVDYSGHLSFSAGGTRERIMISETLWKKLSATERESVVLHEKSHIQNHDPLVRWFVRGALSPMMLFGWGKSLFSLITFYQELRSDELAIRHTSKSTLLSAFVKSLDGSQQNNFVVHFNTNNERLRMLLGESSMIPLSAIVISVVVEGILLFGINIASAQQLKLLDLLDQNASDVTSPQVCKDHLTQSRAIQTSTPRSDDTPPMSTPPLCRKLW